MHAEAAGRDNIPENVQDQGYGSRRPEEWGCRGPGVMRVGASGVRKLLTGNLIGRVRHLPAEQEIRGLSSSGRQFDRRPARSPKGQIPDSTDGYGIGTMEQLTPAAAGT